VKPGQVVEESGDEDGDGESRSSETVEVARGDESSTDTRVAIHRHQDHHPDGDRLHRHSTHFTSLANTRSPEAPAAAGIHLHVSPRPATAAAHGSARRYVSQPLLSDECPSTCGTNSLAGSVPNMAITSVTNTFSVTFCGSLVRIIHVSKGKIPRFGLREVYLGLTGRGHGEQVASQPK